MSMKARCTHDFSVERGINKLSFATLHGPIGLSQRGGETLENQV